MSSLERNILIPRKRCPDPSCMWIGTTERQFCPTCDHTLVSAKGMFYESPMKTLTVTNAKGERTYNDMDSIKSKINWDDPSTFNGK